MTRYSSELPAFDDAGFTEIKHYSNRLVRVRLDAAWFNPGSA